MHDKVFSILVEEDEVTWQSSIMDLIKTEQMNPWDIDLSLLTGRYIQTLKRLKETDLRLSGKVVLCAAMLLRVKSVLLVSEGIMELDRLFAEPEAVNEDEFYEELERSQHSQSEQLPPGLIPHMPMPRKRKVSVFDLVNALEKALEVKRRRVLSSIPELKMEMPHSGANLSLMMKQIYAKVLSTFSLGQKTIYFSQLIPSDSKQDQVATFIPLLHLTNQRKIDLEQDVHFGEISVMLRSTGQEVEKQLQ